MNDDLQAIKDAWDKTTGDGRDEEGTRAMADAYVAGHADEYAGFDNIPLDVLVTMESDARNRGDLDETWKIETWLLHRFEPQNIGGVYQAQVRLPNS